MSVKSLAFLLGLCLAAPAAQALGQPYLSVNGVPGDPGYVFSYDGRSYAGNNHFTPAPGRVLRSSWLKDNTSTSGYAAAELGRLRVAEFGSGRATLANHASFGIGGTLRYASFEDTLRFQGAGLTPDTIARFDYHFGGTAGGRIETNVDQGGRGRLDIDAKLSLQVGSEGLAVRERTWADEIVTHGGQQRSFSASSGLFDVSATGFSMRLGPINRFSGSYEQLLAATLSVQASCLFSLAPLRPDLPAPSGGCSYSADYGNTASFMGISLFDGSSGVRIDPASYGIRSASGFDYASGFATPVPEPQSALLMALGMAGLLLARRASRGGSN